MSIQFYVWIKSENKKASKIFELNIEEKETNRTNNEHWSYF